MVKVKDTIYISDNGLIHFQAWLRHVALLRSEDESHFIHRAYALLRQADLENKEIPAGLSCLQQGLAMADILLDLHLDKETIAASLVYSSVRYEACSLDSVQTCLSETVAKLVQGTMQMDAIHMWSGTAKDDPIQLENTRKMLLAMVKDMRVVIIKLSERTVMMRTLNKTLLDKAEKRAFARETLKIYAPLANRLGIGELKWELEDLSLYYLKPSAYQAITRSLYERRLDREHYTQQIVFELETLLKKSKLKNYKVYGRAKHIYSIYHKMQKKKLKFNELYDLNAMRVLVNTVEECYLALSIIHGTWHLIENQFDDYIASPKPNGYRSIHTAVIGPGNKRIEIQIRTFEMHKESEHGIAAHWQYKENVQQKSSYQAKIAWLRQVLEWQKKLVKTGRSTDPAYNTILNDRIYLFTPAGDIVDLPKGATPLDFAYYIHTDLGHRCCGAKVNGAIVPLTYILNTGEQVDILTSKQAHPRRDWLNLNLGYLITTRAKAKINQWFRAQACDQPASKGVATYAQQKVEQNVDVVPVPEAQVRAPRKTHSNTEDMLGIEKLLTYRASCCKPVPEDPTIGFITRGCGIALHRSDCANILNLPSEKRERLIHIEWSQETKKTYAVDIRIKAYDRPDLVRDVTTLMNNEKLTIIRLTTTTTKWVSEIVLSIEIHNLSALSKILHQVKAIPDVIEASRMLRI